MTTRGENDSRPSRPLVSARPTARDVPIAKYKEVGVGTSPPRGLRGQSLQPGQGAPERINPDEVELAVLREADTLDGPHLARAAIRRSAPELSSSPPPTPVSVEVPRVRSMPPSFEPPPSTPLTPSARSVQSGTLMSIGSVDPRAPTELSLPSPRTLSHAERAAYLGQGAVIDRSPTSNLPSAQNVPHDIARFAKNLELAMRAEAPQSAPGSQQTPRKRGPESSARPSQRADSPAPLARNFARSPDSYAPIDHAHSERAPRESSSSLHEHELTSEPPATDAPRFRIHSDLEALPRDFLDDNFDLRDVHTLREPLAGRRPMPSSEWTPTPPPDSVPSQRDSSVPSARTSHHPSSSSALTLLVDRERRSLPDTRNASPSFPPAPKRAARPIGWVVITASFAFVLVVGVIWIVRQPNLPEAGHAVARTPAERAAALGTAQSSLQAAMPASASPVSSVSSSATAAPSASALAVPVKPLASPTITRSNETAVGIAPARPSALQPSRAPELHVAPATSTQAAPKIRHSIY